MISIKTDSEIQKMREAGKIAAQVLKKLKNDVQPGISTYDLDQIGKRYINELGATSACYGYQYNDKVFPSYTCISVNNEVVHGIGIQSKILNPGDIVSLDVSIFYNGYAADNALTTAVQAIPENAVKLLEYTEKSLFIGIEKALAGNRVGDISFAIQKTIENMGLSVVRDFVGHGIGKQLHEEPQIPNFVTSYHSIRKTPLLRPGMVLAIEPMVNLGGGAVKYADDGWTVLTKDGSLSAHFEHTILITQNKPEILTII